MDWIQILQEHSSACTGLVIKFWVAILDSGGHLEFFCEQPCQHDFRRTIQQIGFKFYRNILQHVQVC